VEIIRKQDLKKARDFIGLKCRAFVMESGEIVEGVFIGFWNRDFVACNSQTTPSNIPVEFPFNVQRFTGGRISVDSFAIYN
jgi:hypothetical protein